MKQIIDFRILCWFWGQSREGCAAVGDTGCGEADNDIKTTMEITVLPVPCRQGWREDQTSTHEVWNSE